MDESHLATSAVLDDVPPVTVSPSVNVPETDSSSNVRTRDCFCSMTSTSSTPVSIFSSE